VGEGVAEGEAPAVAAWIRGALSDLTFLLARESHPSRDVGLDPQAFGLRPATASCSAAPRFRDRIDPTLRR